MAACRASSPATSTQRPPVPPGATENEIFDATRTTPVQLLRDMYESHRFLIIGFTSHSYETQYQILDSLLQQIGRDPRLKIITVERSSESAPLLDETSTHEIAPTEFSKNFPTERSAQIALCGSPEFSYTWSAFMPRIRALNTHRPATNKIRVSTIDTVSFISPNAVSQGVFRELGTSTNFKRMLWDTVDPTDKVILLYHIAHVIKTFTVLNTKPPGDQNGPLPADTAPNGPIARVPSDWMGFLLRDHPEMESQIGIVLLEQNWSTPPDSNLPVLKFTQRQVARAPHQPFGVALAPFRGVLTDRGTTVFLQEPVHAYGTGFASSRTLPAMMDGVIWLPQTKQWSFEGNYLPDVCHGVIPSR